MPRKFRHKIRPSDAAIKLEPSMNNEIEAIHVFENMIGYLPKDYKIEIRYEERNQSLLEKLKKSKKRKKSK